MHQIIFEVIESPEGGFEASAVGHHIHTQGESLEELRQMVQEAVRAHFEGTEKPALVRLMFVREEVLSA